MIDVLYVEDNPDDNAKEYEGHGVGLAIVKRIMQRHHGKVWFFSEPGRETTFYVSFPLA